MRVRSVLPTGPASEICQRPQSVRSKQRHQVTQRIAAVAERGRSEFARLRGRDASAGPGLRLRGSHILSPAQAPPAPNGSQLR